MLLLFFQIDAHQRCRRHVKRRVGHLDVADGQRACFQIGPDRPDPDVRAERLLGDLFDLLPDRAVQSKREEIPHCAPGDQKQQQKKKNQRPKSKGSRRRKKKPMKKKKKKIPW